jgi:hypothetical protein
MRFGARLALGVFCLLGVGFFLAASAQAQPVDPLEASGGGDDLGAIDFDVDPEDAEVYLDGELIGVADNFDGFPSYLWLRKGTYDVVVYRPGFKTLARQISLNSGEMVDFNDEMERGEAVRPEDLPAKSTERREERLRRDRERAAEAAMKARVRDRDFEVGRIHLDIQPDDAAVHLDGRFLGSAGELSFLSAGVVAEPGQHSIEVVRPGYRTEKRSLVVALGESVEVEVELHRD